MMNELRERVAGEITLSDNPGMTIRRWREEFDLSQQQVAAAMNVSHSVISDYESGRRKTPGTGVIKRMVDSFISLDAANGSRTVSKYSPERLEDCVIAMGEFPQGICSEDMILTISGTNLNPDRISGRKIYGYTVIDSLKAILSLGSSDYLKIYGRSTERALIFTDVRYGRSPMVAIRAHPLKPAMVVYIRPDTIDPLAVELSRREGIPLVSSDISGKELIERLTNKKDGV
jgi:putative transcriptional regulator